MTQIDETTFQEIDAQTEQKLTFAQTFAELGLTLSDDNSTTCWVELFQTLKEKHDFISWIDDETWEEDTANDLEDNELLVINQDITYDGNLDLTKLIKLANSDYNILILGNITITGTLVVDALSAFIGGNIQAKKVIISPSGSTVFNGTIIATDCIEFRPSDSYIFNHGLKAPLIVDALGILQFLHGDIDKDSVILIHESSENFEFYQEDYGYTLINRTMLKHDYIDMKPSYTFDSEEDKQNDILSDIALVLVNRLTYAIKNNVPYLK